MRVLLVLAALVAVVICTPALDRAEKRELSELLEELRELDDELDGDSLKRHPHGSRPPPTPAAAEKRHRPRGSRPPPSTPAVAEKRHRPRGSRPPPTTPAAVEKRHRPRGSRPPPSTPAVAEKRHRPRGSRPPPTTPAAVEKRHRPRGSRPPPSTPAVAEKRHRPRGSRPPPTTPAAAQKRDEDEEKEEKEEMAYEENEWEKEGGGKHGGRKHGGGDRRHRKPKNFMAALIRFVMSMRGPVSLDEIDHAKKVLANSTELSTKMFTTATDAFATFIKDPKNSKDFMKSAAALFKQTKKMDLKALMRASEVIFRGTFRGVKGARVCGSLGSLIGKLKKEDAKVDLKTKTAELVAALQKDKECIVEQITSAKGTLDGVGKDKSAAENEKAFGNVMVAFSQVHREVTSLTIAGTRLFYELSGIPMPKQHFGPPRPRGSRPPPPPTAEPPPPAPEKRVHLTNRELERAIELLRLLKENE